MPFFTDRKGMGTTLQRHLLRVFLGLSNGFLMFGYAWAASADLTLASIVGAIGVVGSIAIAYESRI